MQKHRDKTDKIGLFSTSFTKKKKKNIAKETMGDQRMKRYFLLKLTVLFRLQYHSIVWSPYANSITLLYSLKNFKILPNLKKMENVRGFSKNV